MKIVMYTVLTCFIVAMLRDYLSETLLLLDPDDSSGPATGPLEPTMQRDYMGETLLLLDPDDNSGPTGGPLEATM